MNQSLKPPIGTVAGVHVSSHLAGLATINNPACAASVWQRQLPTDLQTWLNDLDPDHLPAGRAVLPVSEIRAVVKELCEDTLEVNEGMARQLIEDCVLLAENFAELMNADYLRIRLDVIENNACKKFHKDSVPVRLVCTYRGTGTQYGTSMAGEDPSDITTLDAGSYHFPW